MSTILETRGMYPTFTRSGKENRATHYCAGCGHGVASKLISEALADMNLQDKTVIVNPVGCGVFGYYYWDAGNIGAAHGRASSVATGVNRSRRGAIAISYQGDGDLGAIGFNSAFQAASRGEHMAVFFVNNGIYGMTGGQASPTTLIGQKTVTTPYGRDPLTDGYPLKVCEVLNQLEAPVYIVRVSVADIKRVLQAKQAIRHALEIQRDRKGYALVEILSPCPTNFKGDAIQSAAYCNEQMEKVFPLGTFRDKANEAPVRPLELKGLPLSEIFAEKIELPDAKEDSSFKEARMKFSGFGGQGILSLGHCVAEAARKEARFTTWLPSYGPEQRGGSAACSVVISGRNIGSPMVDHPDILVCMNQPAYERFLPTVRKGGLCIVDSTVPLNRPVPEGVTVVSMPALALAEEMGTPKAANTVMLGALIASGRIPLKAESLTAALAESFSAKPKIAEKNLEILALAVEKYKALNK